MKNKLYYLKVGLSIILVAYLIRSIGLSNMYKTIRTGNATFFLFAALFIPIFVLLKTLKWHLMVRYAGAKEDFFTSLRAILFGLGVSVFTPARAGEILRVKYYCSVDRIMVGGLVIVDRLIDLITVLSLGIYFVISHFSPVVSVITIGINAFLSVLLLLLGRLITIYRLMPERWRKRKMYGYLEKIGASSKALTPINMVLFSGISFLNWIFIMLQFYFIINIYYVCKFQVAMACLPIIQLSNLIPITIAGIGVRENLSVFVMKSYNIPNEVAAISAFSLYATDVLIPGIIGLVLFGSKK